MLNENLKSLRKQKGVTQEEIASRLHVVRQTVSKREKAFWNILTVIGIVVLLWGLSGCVSAVTKGVFRAIVGIAIVLISRFMSRSLV